MVDSIASGYAALVVERVLDAKLIILDAKEFDAIHGIDCLSF